MRDTRQNRFAPISNDLTHHAALERFTVNWNRSQAAPAGTLGARRSSGAPAQARTLGSAAVSEKNLERFQATWNCASLASTR